MITKRPPMFGQSKINPLTSLRFFAAFYVVLHHTVPDVFRINLNATWFGHFLNMGVVSVSFFFVLSGYILATVYLKRGKAIDHKQFWIARFARIYPLFVAALLLDVPNLILKRMVKYSVASTLLKTVVTFVANLFMLQAWILRFRGLDNPNWSLSVESLFYLIFPFVGLVLWRLPARRAVTVGIATYLAGLVAVYALTRTRLPLDFLKFNPLLHLHEFICGILICRLHSAWSSSIKFNWIMRRFAAHIVVGCAVLYALIVQFSKSIPYAVLHDGLLIPIFGCLIVVVASGDSLPASLLSWAPLVVLGEASYALYLVHVPLWNYFQLFHPENSIATYLIFLVSAVGGSVLSFYVLESPSRKAIVNWFAQRAEEPLVPALEAAGPLQRPA